MTVAGRHWDCSLHFSPHITKFFFFLLTTRSFPAKAEFGRKQILPSLLLCDAVICHAYLSCVFVTVWIVVIFLFFFLCFDLFFVFKVMYLLFISRLVWWRLLFCIEFVLLSSSDRRWSNETQIITNATHQFMFGFTTNTPVNAAAAVSSLSTLFFPFTLRLYSIQLIQIITNWIEPFVCSVWWWVFFWFIIFFLIIFFN